MKRSSDTNSMLQIDSDYLFNFVEILYLVVGFSIVIRILLPSTIDKFSIDIGIINLLKFVGYGILATYIYRDVYINSKTEVDVLVFFTFLLAAFESAHNFILTIGTAISVGVRWLIDNLFKNKHI